MVDEWSGRPPQSTEFPKTETDGIKALIARLSGLATELRESTSNLLRTAGIYITKAGMRIASALRVEGELIVTGNAVFEGDLAVPNGSITNDALQSPVSFDSGKAITSGSTMNLLTTEQTFCTLSFTVPAGYTRALVQGQGSIGVVNPTAGSSSVAGRVYIDHPNVDPGFGARRWQSSAAGADAAVTPVHAEDFTVSGGDVITVRLTVQGGPSISWGTTSGGATLSASVLLSR